jgi:hypothetical protein
MLHVADIHAHGNATVAITFFGFFFFVFGDH